jgi:hypothetical protein
MRPRTTKIKKSDLISKDVLEEIAKIKERLEEINPTLN